MSKIPVIFRTRSSSLVPRSSVLLMRSLLFLTVVLALVPVLLVAYDDEPPPAHTGGFGEPTCAACHDGNPINADGGALHLEGIPQSYTPGRSYTIRIALRRDGLQRAGFQVASRFAQGPSTGTQAGTWTVDGDLVQATMANAVVYVEQTKKGNVVKPTGAIDWSVDWQAPAAAQGAVTFHVSANASNRDDSALGDFIYVTSATSEPAVPNVARARPGPTRSWFDRLSTNGSVPFAPSRSKDDASHSSSASPCPKVPDAFCMRYVLISPSRSPSSTRFTSPTSTFVR